ncbi:MAG: hypothetical protein WD016_03670 [Balneolaceae bacterium]
MLKIILVLFFFCCPDYSYSQNHLTPLDDIIFDGSYFYAIAINNYKLLKIDTTGKVVSEFGEKGRGPNEFLSANIELTLIGEKLYALDKQGYRIVEIDTKTFTAINEKLIKGNPIDLLSLNNHLSGLFIRRFKSEVNEKLPEMEKTFTVENLFPENVETESFFKFKEEELNPFYDQKSVHSIGANIVIHYPYRSSFHLFKDDQLHSLTIPSVEPLALGNEIDRNFQNQIIRNRFKYEKIANYELVKSIIASNTSDKIIFNISSYKMGNSLFEFDLSKQTFSIIGAFHYEKAIGMDANQIYYLDENVIAKTTLSSIRACANDTLEVFISSFNQQCSTCKESLNELFEVAKQYHVPVNIFVKDSSWFSSADEEDYREAAEHLSEWGIWGSIKFTDECNDCFNSNISVRFVTDSQKSSIKRLPVDKSIIHKSFSCIPE